MVELDKTDLKIIYELYKNGRAFNTEIAKRLNTSKEVVNYRIKRLIKNKILLKTIPLIDYSKLGYNIFRLQINIRSTDKEQITNFLEYTKNISQIGWIIELSGDWDYALLFFIKEINEFNEIYSDMINKYGSLINDKLFTIVNEIIHYNPMYLFENLNISKEKIRHKIVTGNNKNNYLLDSTSKKILNELFIDSRQSLTEISNKLNVSITTIKYHMNRFKKNKIILNYRPIINTNLLGYEHFKILIDLYNPSQRNNLFHRVEENPHTIYISNSLGKYDFEFEAEYKKTKDLLAFIEEIKKDINIKSFKIIFSNKEIKINEIPK